MNKLFLSFIVLSLIFWSCENSNTDEDQNQVPEDAPIEEITTSVNTSKEKAPVEKQEAKPKLAPDFAEFVAKFPHVSLPYELNPDFEGGDNEDAENTYAKIPLEQQVKYLSVPEELKKADFEEMAEYTDYYFVSSPVINSNFTAVIYGRFEMGSIFYYLCTYDNQGKFISGIEFAAYNMLGAGPQAGQYTITHGKIDKDMNVTVTFDDLDGSTTTTKYKINENGKITEIK